MGEDIASLLSGAGLPALEARLLLAHSLNLERTALITRAAEIPAAPRVAAFHALVRRRLAGEPIAQLLGSREFFGLRFDVTPAVLIPRPETELLVELALERLHARVASSVLDLGTGSGAVAVAIADQCPTAVVTATDSSAAALTVAAANAQRLLPAQRPGGPLRLLMGDWYGALALAAGPAPQFDVIVSNPPYIAAGDPHLTQGDLRFEPTTALTDGADGLSAIRHIVSAAPAWLRPGGVLLLEHGYDQAAAVRQCYADAGLLEIGSAADLAGIERVTYGVFSPR